MKNLIAILIITTLSFSACTTSDDDFTNNRSSFNPPQWIQGTWLMEDSGMVGYKFTSDDFCSISPYQTLCFKSTIQQAPEELIVDEQIDNENYIITINQGGYITNSFHFRKYSHNVIEDVSATDEFNIRYVKQ